MADTVAPVLALKPVLGVQVYVLAPVAVRVVLLPGQIDDGGGTTITGLGLTVTVTVVVPVHPLISVPVMVYVVVVPGLAFTVAPVLALNPIFGAHV